MRSTGSSLPGILLAFVLAFGLGLVLMIAAGAAPARGPSRPPDLALDPFPAEVASRILAIRNGTAEIRGLKAAEGIQEGTISRRGLALFIRQARDQTDVAARERLAGLSVAYRLLRLIPPEYELDRISEEFQAEQIAGLYFPEQRKLVLVGDLAEIGLEQELTLSHEFIHSLQDAAYGISAMRERAKTAGGESEAMLTCVLEGDAMFGSILYMNRTHGPGWIQQAAGQSTPGGVQGSARTPASIQRYFLFNYLQCTTFITALYARGGWQQIDALYARLPQSSEQVLHIDKYLANEPPLPLEQADLSRRLGAAWSRRTASAFGEFDVYNLLLTLGGSEINARQAASGWGAGRISVYAGGPREGDNLLQLTLLWDSAAAFTRFKTEYGRSLMRQPLAQRSVPAGGDVWNWSDQAEFAEARWDATARRVDILIGTSRRALERALAALGPVQP